MDSRVETNAPRQIRTLYSLGTLGGLPDARLLEIVLERSIPGADEAFAALVDRHGPMVLGICRRMLRCPQDRDDVFQATFLVLARRAPAIGRREHLAGWLHGVAVRTAKEARRRTARRRAEERKLMEMSPVDHETREDHDDLVSILDEELKGLPERYRAALVACELEGKTRREAARELGLPEGTLSTHLARGRKLLHARLLRRGFGPGLSLLAALGTRRADAALSERLLHATVSGSLGALVRGSAAATVPAGVSALADRVLKGLWLTRIGLAVAAVFALGLGAAAAAVLGFSTPAEEPPQPAAAEARRAGDFQGRVIDATGQAVAGVQVWIIGGRSDAPETIARATTDGQGRFAAAGVPDLARKARAGGQELSLFARAGDGRVGWRGSPVTSGAEVELRPVGEVRGRVLDAGGRPVAGAVVEAQGLAPRAARYWSERVNLPPELTASYRTTTDADGSYVFPAIPKGAEVWTTVTSKRAGTSRYAWNSAEAATLTLDERLGRIRGRVVPPAGQRLAGRVTVSVNYTRALADPPPGSAQLMGSASAVAGEDGSFQLDGLAPGRYQVRVWFAGDAPFTAQPVDEVAVGPGATARLDVPLTRLVTIQGRVVNARTRRGIAGIPICSFRLENQYLTDPREAVTDAEGHYSVLAQPGKVMIKPKDLPATYLATSDPEKAVEVRDNLSWPDLELTPAAALDVLVVDASGRPAPEAEVFLLAWELPGASRRSDASRTKADGTVHLEQLDPDDTVSLWARAGEATSGETLVVRPGEVKGPLTMRIDPKLAVQIDGTVVGRHGRSIEGARVMLWWTRPYLTRHDPDRLRSTGNLLTTATTGAEGRFAFPALWPGIEYRIVVKARGHTDGEVRRLSGKASETLKAGRIVLIGNQGQVAGRVVGSDGRPIAGAEVSNRGDSLDQVAASTDGQGRFRLEGLLSGPKYIFVRKGGYRFTGIRVVDDVDDLAVRLLKRGEPPPPWKPAPSPALSDQLDLARRILTRLWDTFGADAENNGAFACILDMAEIDPAIALAWSAQKGHRYDDRISQDAAMIQAETDAPGAIRALRVRPGRGSQASLQQLAERYEKADPAKALAFAEEAAAQARALEQPHRGAALAQAGEVLVRLGRAPAGRALIDEAADAAAHFGHEGRSAYCRGLVARALAPFELERALTLIEPIKGNDRDRYYASTATAIASRDMARAMALVEKVGGNAFYHEMARTEIAYIIGADRPDEALKIIEGMNRWPQWSANWKAEALGWLAVALAPREPERAFGLIDRALEMLIDDRDQAQLSGGPLTSAVHVASCARRAGYPDMESVLMRVMATRPSESAPGARNRSEIVELLTKSAVPLALLDPGAARLLLEQIEERAGFDPADHWPTREPWLIAWALVDPKKAEVLFELAMTTLGDPKQVQLWSTGFLSVVEILAAPPRRREAAQAVYRSGGAWHPGDRL